MPKSEALSTLSRGQLEDLIEIYCKNWLAMDGVWFQQVEATYGMDAAMGCDAAIWERFTAIEAQKIKKFLELPEHAGLDGLEKAMSLRLYANINHEEYTRKGDTLLYRTLDCRVQSARMRKGMPPHPCIAAGIPEFTGFAHVIDERIVCEVVSCYPETTDDTCACAWRFTLKK
ncbi:MAG: DUF6125 family protein [Clostridiaceae bacterium]|nr:DUF6125 family protein [Clostridiaceae bacterium]